MFNEINDKPTAIAFENREAWENCLQLINKENIRWSSGYKALERTEYWRLHKDNTCIIIANNKLYCSGKEYFTKINYKIVNYNELQNETNEEN